MNVITAELPKIVSVLVLAINLKAVNIRKDEVQY